MELTGCPKKAATQTRKKRKLIEINNRNFIDKSFTLEDTL